MKKLLIVFFAFFVFAASGFSAEQIGRRLKYEITYSERNSCSVRITDVYEDWYLAIYVQRNINEIFDIYKEKGGRRKLGTAELNSSEFQSIIAQFIIRESQGHDAEWNQYAYTIANKICMQLGGRGISQQPLDNRVQPVPGNASLYLTYGVSFFNKGDYDTVIAYFTEAIRLEPNNALAYSNRGSVYYRKDDYNRAIADYTQALRLDPNNAIAREWLGPAWRALGY